jgi:nucleotide-binding universal stress UspA family protein
VRGVQPVAEDRTDDGRVQQTKNYCSDGQQMKILLPIDDSKCSQAALKSVVTRVWSPGTEVKVLHVIAPPSHLLGREMKAYDPEFEAVWNARRDQAKALVSKTMETLRGAGLSVTPALQEGDARSQIIDVAKDWHADLIVLGSHGRMGLQRFLLGSVSEAVVRHAHCSVEVVRTQT